MAARFWVGGTANWDASTTANWAATSGGAGGASVPTASDDITLDGLSGGGTVTITATANCLSLTMIAFTGTLNTNGQTVNCTNIFNVSGTSTRGLTLGASSIVCGTWTASNTGLTFSPGTSTISMNGITIFTSGGLTYNNVNLNCATTGIQTIDGGTYANLNVSNVSGLAQRALSGNVTVTTLFTCNGTDNNANRNFLTSSIAGTQRTITAASVSLTNTDFQDIIGAGVATWTGTSMGNCFGNSNITFDAPRTVFWKSATAANWLNSISWFNATNGGGGAANMPLPQDIARFDANCGVGSPTIGTDGVRMGTVNYTSGNASSKLTASNRNFTIFGSFICGGVNHLNIGGAGDMTFGGRGSFTIESGGGSWSATGTASINCVTGIYTLVDNCIGSTSNMFEVLSGTFVDAGFTLTTAKFTSNRTLTRSVIKTADWTITGNSAVWSVTSTGFTFSDTHAIIFTDATSSGKTLALGNVTTYNTILFTGAGTGNYSISGSNTINTLQDNNIAAHSIIFSQNTTQTINNWAVSGTAGNLITLTSSSSTAYTLVYTGTGVVSADYLNIQHCKAKNGNYWYAGTHSVNNQNISSLGSGWVFTAPGLTKSNFFALM